MLESFFLNLSLHLNHFPVIIIWIIQIIFCYICILLALKYYGKSGIYVYVAMAIFLANIQVLKVIEFPFFPEPMALGTILFLSIFYVQTFLVNIMEKKAQQNVFILEFQLIYSQLS